MSFSIIRQITNTSWMLSSQALVLASPLLSSVLNGASFTRVEPKAAVMMSPPGSKSDNVIAVEHIQGIMLKNDVNCGPIGTTTIAKRIKRNDADTNVSGHILVFDSGGGASNSVPALADAIKNAKKPVVAFIDGCACSAAIYAASYCDHIVASNDMDIVGSVGVLIEFAGFPKFAQLPDGRNAIRVYADQSSEKNLGFEEALNNDFKVIKETLLNPLAERFVSDIKSNRPGVNDTQVKGAVYFAKDVIGSFIDEIGSLEIAAAKVVELSADESESDVQSTHNNMDLNNINQVPSCAELQVDSDGGAYLNSELLQDLNTALANSGNIDTENALRETISQHESTINTVTTERDSLQVRVADLEQVIEKGNAGAPSAGDLLNEDSISEEESAYNYCQQHLKDME